jgi:hypothetical protein
MKRGHDLKINIDGLSSEAVEMLDVLFSIDTEEHLKHFKELLDAEQLALCQTCEQLLILAVQDALFEDFKDFEGSEAEEVINRIRGK